MSKKHIPDSSCQYFNEKEETLTREQIEALQLERLQATVKHCMNSPFYKKRFEEAGLKPEDIKMCAKSHSQQSKICVKHIHSEWQVLHSETAYAYTLQAEQQVTLL